MGTSLSGTQISATYSGILKSTDNAVLNGTLRTITDGLGNDSALQVSTAGVKSTGTLDVAGAAAIAGALTLTGGLNTPLVLAQGGSASATAAGARATFGVTATGADTTYNYRANNLSDVASAATARTNLGLFGSNLEGTSGVTQNGTTGADVVLTGCATISLTAGTWLVLGTACMRLTDSGGAFMLGFRDNTDGVDFGQGAIHSQGGDWSIIQHLTCNGVYVVASGTKVIYLKGYRYASNTLTCGGGSGNSSTIRAVRLTT